MKRVAVDAGIATGLVEEVLADDAQAGERAYAYAKKLAAHSPIATQAVKAAVARRVHAGEGSAEFNGQ